MHITRVCLPVPREYLQFGDLCFVLLFPVFVLKNDLLNEHPLLVHYFKLRNSVFFFCECYRLNCAALKFIC